MRFITTYNENIYNFSAFKLIESIRRFVPFAEIKEYNEDDVRSIPEFTKVLDANKDVILKSEGGNADSIPQSNKGWQFNSRWFNWFKKIAVQYDCIKRNPFLGYSLFCDADIRLIGDLNEEDIELSRAVGVFQGDREVAETGLLILNEGDTLILEFYDQLMQYYISGEFREYDRWDDSFSITKIKDRNPDIVEDLAENISASTFTNSNEHTTVNQIIPFTKWGQFIEHDKGIHIRNKIS